MRCYAQFQQARTGSSHLIPISQNQRLWRMRTEPHPFPTEPCICGALAAAPNYSATPPSIVTPPNSDPCSAYASFPRCKCPGGSPRPPFLPLPTGPPPPGLPRSLAASPSPCPRTRTLPNTMGERWEGAASARQVTSVCRQSGSSVTRSPLLLPPRPRRGSKSSSDLGGLTAAARARHRHRRRAASRARARQGRGRGPRRLLVPHSWSRRPGVAASRPRVLRALPARSLFFHAQGPPLACLVLSSPR